MDTVNGKTAEYTSDTNDDNPPNVGDIRPRYKESRAVKTSNAATLPVSAISADSIAQSLRSPVREMHKTAVGTRMRMRSGRAANSTTTGFLGISAFEEAGWVVPFTLPFILTGFTFPFSVVTIPSTGAPVACSKFC